MSHDVVSEIWHVQLPTGQTHRLTLDELDAAFEAGHITEATLVLPPGGTSWTTLGAAAGLGGDAAHTESVTPAPVSVATPISMEIQAAPSSLAPMAINMTPSFAPPAPLPTADLPDIDFEAAHKSGRRKLVFGAIGTGIVLVGLGVVGARFMNQAEASGNTFHNAVSAPGPETRIGGGDDGPSRPQLSEEQKKKLEEADKARQAAAAAKRKVRDDARPTPSKPFKGDDPLKKSSGNKYDPLNGNL